MTGWAWEASGPHHGGLQNPLALEIVQRPKERSCGLHPAAQRAAGQIHAMTRENVFQAIQRKMIAELADDHLRDQTGSSDAAWDWPWCNGSRGDAVLAPTASVLGSHVDMSFQLGRLKFQLPSDVFTDAVHRATTARAHLFFVGQVVLMANLPQLVPINFAFLTTTMAFDFDLSVLVRSGGVFRCGPSISRSCR